MSCSLSLSRFFTHRQAFAQWRHWPAAIVAMVGCLTSLPLAFAQDPNPVPKRAAAKDQSASDAQPSQARDRDKLLAEQQRLLDEETKHSEAGKYVEAIKTSQQRESVLLELAKLPDRKAAANQMRLDLLQARKNWQSMSGQIADAVQTSEQRLQLVEAEFGAQHWQSASARFELDGFRKIAATDEPTRVRMWELEQQANAASAKGDYREAIAKAEALKDIEAQVLGVEHPFYANSLASIAGYCQQARDFERAILEWQATLTIREKALGPDHPDTARSLKNLAELYESQANYATAEPLYQRALKVKEKALGPDHPDTVMSLNNLADLYHAQANYAAAEPLYLLALKIHEKALGPDHPDTATSFNNLAGLYRAQANYAAAEPLYRRALKIHEKALGRDHPNIAASLNNLASLYQSQRNFADAERLYRWALKINENAFGPDHPATATSLNDLAGLFMSQANYAAAEPLYRRALQIREKALGFEHLDVVKLRANIANLQTMAALETTSSPLHLIWERQFLRLKQQSHMQSEEEQLLASDLVTIAFESWLSESADNKATVPKVCNDLLAWRGHVTLRQLRLRQVLKHDPQFIEYGRVCIELSNLELNPQSTTESFSVKQGEQSLDSGTKWETRRDRLRADREQLEKKLSWKRGLLMGENDREAPVELIQQLLPEKPRAALVIFTRYKRNEKPFELDADRLTAFIIRRNAIDRVELGPTVRINQEIAVWRKQQDVAAGTWLRAHLWEPLRKHLDGIEVILISPDAALAQFPWGALPGEQPGHFLIEERQFAVIPIPQILPELLEQTPRRVPPDSLLLAGDIDYGIDPDSPHGLLAKSDLAVIGHVRGEKLKFIKLDAAQAELASVTVHTPAIPQLHGERSIPILTRNSMGLSEQFLVRRYVYGGD